MQKTNFTLLLTLPLQEKVMAVRRRQMRHVLFTEPEVIDAGTQVSIYLLLFWCQLTGTPAA